MKNQKHAYLIMAHNEPQLLLKLLRCLDDERNDLYLHLDKRFDSISEDEIRGTLEKSGVFFIDRKPVYWSGYSQVDCEFRMLKGALPGAYKYYHFISGVDLPLKTQDYIHNFFEEHNGQEFVHADPVETWKIASRYKYYHFEKINNLLSRKWSRSLRFVSSFIQALFFINKVRNHDVKKYYWGAAWFSVTHSFAEFIIENEPKIFKFYNHGFFNDEVFLATLLMNSDFRDKIGTFDDTRLIDWTRGNPYTWTSNEFEELMSSKALFCRKFSLNKDAEIVEKIIAEVQ